MATTRRPCTSVREAIGATPIIALDRLAAPERTRVFGKCEFMNPGGSIKDRIAFRMVDTAEREGLLRAGGTIVEATAGNTGMGLAMVAALRGYKLVAVMTTKMSREKVNAMKAFGATVVICPYEVPCTSPEHFINRARQLARETPGAWYADQFGNRSNVAAHYESTGPEIWEQMGGDIDALVAGIGTGGTMCGAGAFLRQQNPDIRLVLADPVGSILGATIEGDVDARAAPYLVEGIGGDFVPPIAELDLVDEVIKVSDAEAIEIALRTFRTEGLFVGASSGCILAAALQYRERARRARARIVAVLPDGGRAYLSTIYDPDWRRRHHVEGIDDRPPANVPDSPAH
jgi:cystathionine beta-synthase